MTKRGRPKLQRAPDDVITGSGLTVGQRKWLVAGFHRRGYASAAHYLRHIVNQHIAFVEAGNEDDLGPVPTRKHTKER